MENDLLKVRQDLIDYVKKTISSSKKNAEGLRSMKERGFSSEGMLDKVIEVTAIQSDQIKMLGTILLTYVSSYEFTSKLAKGMVLSNEEMANSDS